MDHAVGISQRRRDAIMEQDRLAKVGSVCGRCFRVDSFEHPQTIRCRWRGYGRRNGPSIKRSLNK